jgi:hypothetical protein
MFGDMSVEGTTIRSLVREIYVKVIKASIGMIGATALSGNSCFMYSSVACLDLMCNFRGEIRAVFCVNAMRVLGGIISVF